MASGERDALQKKAEAVKAAKEQAEAELQQLREDHEAKTEQLEKLKSEKTQTLNSLRKAEHDYQVWTMFVIRSAFADVATGGAEASSEFARQGFCFTSKS